MDYNRVGLFVQVVKSGSFTAAAAVAGLPKSSVSRSVSRLEEELGVVLLQRTTRKLALTEVGQRYYDTVAGSMAALDQAGNDARERGVTPTGTVRVTAPPDLAGLPEAIARFTRQHAGIRVELTLTSRVVDLVTEGFDLALRAGRLPDSSLISRRIGSSEASVMAAPAYLRRRGRPRQLSDLSGHDWVLFRATGGRATLTLKGPAGEEVVEVEGALVADDMGFCLQATEAGAGMALLPIHTAQEALRAGRIEQVLPAYSYGGASLFVVLPTSRYVPARVALVRDFLVDALGKQMAAVTQQCQRAQQAALRRRA
jgi:DNA-binding transcriptional LysR family regulator